VSRAGYEGAKTSAAVGPVAAADPDALTGTVTISGTTQVGQTLTADTSGLGGTGAITYLWLRDGTAIPGATSATYTLTAEDEGKKISVSVSRAGNSGSVSSAATVEVTPAPVATVTGVSVTPATETVAKGGEKQFTATVNGTNSPSQAVTWSVTGTPAKATGTTLNGGLLTVATDESAATLTVTATSDADNTKSGSATVTVSGTATVTSVAVTPATVDLWPGETQTFTVTVTGTNNPSRTVTWAVSGNNSQDTKFTGNTLTVAAGETAASFTVQATSVVDSIPSNTAIVTIPSVTGVTINPLTPSVARGGSRTFTATVTGTPSNPSDQAVTWSVSGASGGTSINPTTGVLTVSTTQTTGNNILTVQATSVYGGTPGTTTVTVPDSATLNISGLGAYTEKGYSVALVPANTAPADFFDDDPLAVSEWGETIPSANITVPLYTESDSIPLINWIPVDGSYIAVFVYGEYDSGGGSETFESEYIGYTTITLSGGTASFAFSDLEEVNLSGYGDPVATITIDGLGSLIGNNYQLFLLPNAFPFVSLQEEDVIAGCVESDGITITAPSMTFYLYDNPHSSAELTLPGTYTILLVYGQSDNYAAKSKTITLTNPTGSVNYPGGWADVDLSIFDGSGNSLDLTDVTAETFGISYTQSQSYTGQEPAIEANGTHYRLTQDYTTARSRIEGVLGNGYSSSVALWRSTALSDAAGPWVILEVIHYTTGGGDQIRLVTKPSQGDLVGTSWNLTSTIGIIPGTYSLSSNATATYNYSRSAISTSGIQYLLSESSASARQKIINTYGQPNNIGSFWYGWYNPAYFDLNNFVVLELFKAGSFHQIHLLARENGGERHGWTWD
jgi:hypothetical protein